MMREKTAIKYSMEMWEFLKDNPDKWKDDFPKYKKYKTHKMQSECHCCGFYKECDKCPLLYYCDIDSEFDRWCDNIDKKENATAIYKCLKKYYNSKWGK